MLSYDFPLRPHLLAPMRLPVRLTRLDAERIIQFVNVLAFDGRREEPPPRALRPGLSCPLAATQRIRPDRVTPSVISPTGEPAGYPGHRTTASRERGR